MAYVSLYRKWRPQTFADVIGQDHIVNTLVNAIRTGQVHHAMLFTGTRGTGKTSTARILAKALNCERGPTPDPDNTCAACRSITDGTALDVVEIDAASHGSVDDTRDLREKATYVPASLRYKVYIVDEAHMVTPQGFNAMLKVLEEPPEHVRFVFATTEPHKVIEAIRSRCQQHDFRRVRTALLVEHYAKICDAEGVVIEPAALELVARAAGGSVRDGLSRLDQVRTYAGSTVGLADVAQVLGTLPTELRFDLAEALATRRVADAFACVERVIDSGHDLTQFAREALEHLRDLFVIRVAPDSPNLVDVTPETRERLLAQAERFGPGELGRLVRILGDVYLDLRTATDQRLVLEVGLARAALPEASLDADALLTRIERLERRLAIGDGAPVPLAQGPELPIERSAPPARPAAAAEPAAFDRPARSGQAAPPDRPAAAAGPAPSGQPASSGQPATAGAAPSDQLAATGPAFPDRPAAAGPAFPDRPAAASPAPSDRPAPAAGEEPAATRRPAAAGQRARPPGRAAAPASEPQAPEPDGWTPRPTQAGVGGVDLDLVRRSWPLVMERVAKASRVTAMYLERGQPVGLEGQQVVLEFPPDAEFHAKALSGRERQVSDVLDTLLGGGLGIRVVIGEGAGGQPSASEEPVPPPAEPPPPADFDVDLGSDEGQPLDPDADARAVADLVTGTLGGEVIEQRPNEPTARRAGRGARTGSRPGERGKR